MAASTSGQARRFSWGSILGPLQNIGRALMLPIAVLPAAALLLRLGQDDVLGLPWMAAAGDAIFANLAILFAIGIAVGLTGSAGAAGLAAVVGFLVFEAVFNSIATGLADGDQEPIVSMGVLAGIVVGLVTAGLYRRYNDIRLPDYLAFFGGKRFVPIVTALATLVLGAAFGFVWPVVGSGIEAMGQWLVGLGAVGTGIYGFLNRLLIPLGLHHVLNTYIWFQLGSYQGPDGVVQGEITRYFAGDPNAGSFLAGFFPIMMFGLPAACLAMIRHAHQTRVASGILLSAAFASFLTGITEPIEFAFLFVAPVLFLIHALLTASAMVVTTLLGIQMGFGFSAGAIDYVLNFFADNTDKPFLLLLVGLAYGGIYYFVFSFFIKRFDLATPGRGGAEGTGGADWILPESQRGPAKGSEDSEDSEPTEDERDRDDVLAENALAALGGRENVESVEGCITRLRCVVSDPEAVNEDRLKELGASGVIKRGQIVQVVMGTQSDRIADRMNRQLKTEA